MLAEGLTAASRLATTSGKSLIWILPLACTGSHSRNRGYLVKRFFLNCGDTIGEYTTMMTFKQLEAVYWIVRLGGFSQAATKLHTSQSAISKRVQELESLFGTSLFDRAARTSRLTEKGQEMFAIAKRLLEERDSAVEQFLSPEGVERSVRIGVTELTAMTWLPRLVNLIEARYPRVTIEPDVDNSRSLREKIASDELDLMVVPGNANDARLSSRTIGAVQNAWMCKPGLVPARKALKMQELAAYRLLTQSERSGTGSIYAQWLEALGVAPSEKIISNNLVAIIGMTVSGLGVSHLPRKCLQPMIREASLAVIRTIPELPDIPYIVAHKAGRTSALVAGIVGLAEEACDFGTLYQTG
jgi:DNA-binding transcriptional LysR family regulator